jgi:hypothetical protein
MIMIMIIIIIITTWGPRVVLDLDAARRLLS